MKIFIQAHPFGAGKWIYQGYMDAWEKLGFETECYESLSELSNLDIGEYDIMAIDHNLTEAKLPETFYGDSPPSLDFLHRWTQENIATSIEVLSKARRAYLFTQPTNFPLPWGNHSNFRNTCSLDVIKQINSMKNIKKWTFAKVNKEYYELWEDVSTILLGFDDINYKPIEDSSMKYDVCYVGGWANNGFNEKEKIMIEHFKEIKKLNLKCGILINKNISHTNEMKLLYNSKISINIHDAYQRQLGTDTNERTYKSLGLTGFLISDKVEALDNIFPELPQAATPKKMAELITQYMDLNLDEIKEKNRQDILENHTYVNRAKQMMEL
jgi:flagellar biosynthesis/type III secretory pathway chaperone